MKNEKIESLPASELDLLLWNFFLNARKKNGEEYEPATVSSFQRSIQRYLSEKKYPFNILKDNEFEKSRSESHLFTSTAKETNRKLLRLSTKTKTKRMSFLKQENFMRLQSSCASKNCVVVFIPTLRFPSKRRKS